MDLPGCGAENGLPVPCRLLAGEKSAVKYSGPQNTSKPTQVWTAYPMEFHVSLGEGQALGFSKLLLECRRDMLLGGCSPETQRQPC